MFTANVQAATPTPKPTSKATPTKKDTVSPTTKNSVKPSSTKKVSTSKATKQLQFLHRHQFGRQLDLQATKESMQRFQMAKSC